MSTVRAAERVTQFVMQRISYLDKVLGPGDEEEGQHRHEEASQHDLSAPVLIAHVAHDDATR
eukprot:24577-Eustigmatos_ZCMA.PRE.1